MKPIFIVLLCLLLLFIIIVSVLWGHIKVFILNNLIIARGILGPNCYWFNISDKLLDDGSGINLFYKFRRQQGDVPKTYANIDKAKQDLDYNPIISLEEGLKITCNWLKNII